MESHSVKPVKDPHRTGGITDISALNPPLLAGDRGAGRPR